MRDANRSASLRAGTPSLPVRVSPLRTRRVLATAAALLVAFGLGTSTTARAASTAGTAQSVPPSTTTNPLAFAPAQAYSPNPGDSSVLANGVVVADVNGDGQPDMVADDRGSSSVSVIPNGGSGSFAQTYAVGNHPAAVAVADLNGDGFPDIVTANTDASTMSVLLNDGTSNPGNFAPAVTYDTGTTPAGIAIADFNGDGHPDVVTVDNQSNSVSVMLNNGDTTFAFPTDYAVGAAPNGVVVGDFNGDGHPDIAATNYGTSNQTSNTVSVLYANGSGGFAAQQTFAAGDRPFHLAVADLNGDGHPDLVVTDWGSIRNGTDDLTILLNNGLTDAGAGFDAPSETALPNQSASASSHPTPAVGDLNGDGKADVVVSNGPLAYVFAGQGDGTFASPPAGVATGGNTQSVDVGDMNGDGLVDVVATEDYGTVSVNLHEAAPTETARPTLQGPALVGHGLYGGLGGWKGIGPLTVTWKLQACDANGKNCADIPGASGTSYIVYYPTTSDVGSRLRVGVFAANDAGYSATVYSAPTKAVPPPPADTSPPTISGSLVDGSKVTAGGDLWNLPVQRSYGWWQCPSSDTDPSNYPFECSPFAYGASVKLSRYVVGDKIEVVERADSRTNGTAVVTTGLYTVLGINPFKLKSGTVGTAYVATLTASGGTAPYTWTVVSGSLPTGLSLSPSGKLKGTPTAGGTYDFVLGVADSSSPMLSANRPYSISIS